MSSSLKSSIGSSVGKLTCSAKPWITVGVHGFGCWASVQLSLLNSSNSCSTSAELCTLPQTLFRQRGDKQQSILLLCTDHLFKEEEMKSVGELSQVCSQIVLKCLYLARIGRPGILWSVYKLARSITKWTKACDKRPNRLISYVHHICEYKQYCHVGNTAKQCRLGLFQDSDFAGDLEDSKSTSGGLLCIFGSRTFVPISWMCKKQTSVSHS